MSKLTESNKLNSRREFLKTSSLSIAMASLGLGCSFSETDLAHSKRIVEDQKLYPIKTLETVWIPMPDGRRLAARVWMPIDAESSPVPSVLELIPYRKGDLQRNRDDYIHGFTAKRGYACLRVDIGGTGDSDGLISDEYSKQEHSDCLEILKWIAKQPWSTGKVGMRGISWGGFNSLQIAAMNPPELKAIIPHCATDDRYLDDAHYLGGALTRANWDWAQLFMNVMSMPADPSVKSQWKEEWLDRLNNAWPAAHRWLNHQTKDDYWKHGSVSTDYSAIKCPVYAAVGTVDSYTNFLPRLLENLEAPCKGFMGPNGHQFPDLSDPGPAVGFLYEEIRWWDHWLKGIDTGMMDEPQLQFFMQEKVPGQVYPESVPGRWAAEHEWPSQRIEQQVLYLNELGLSNKPGEIKAITLAPNQTTGMNAPHFLPFNMGADLPKDQSEDDDKSLVFESDVLKEDIEILGRVKLNLNYSSDQPIAKVSVRLNEVLSDNSSWCVTSGVLNLTHRDSHEKPELLVPHKKYETPIELKMMAHKFKAGSRIRISISESNWPVLWPSPKPVNFTVIAGKTFVSLPVRPKGSGNLEGVSFSAPPADEGAGAMPIEMGAAETNTIGPDALGRMTSEIISDSGLIRLNETGTEFRIKNQWLSTIHKDDPTSASWSGYFSMELRREGWDIKVRSDYEVTADTDNFILKTTLDAEEMSKNFFTREWNDKIKREFI